MRLKKRNKDIFLFFIVFGTFLLFINYLFNTIKLNSNEEFVKKILQNSNHHLINDFKSSNKFYNFVNKINNINLNNPVTIVDKVFAYNTEKETLQTFSYIQNNVVDNPRVYIYSTHPTEAYLGERLDGYNLGNNVILASVILQEKLNAMGIYTVVEERSAADYIKEHNLLYSESYQATRTFLKDKLKDNKFDLIIDLHRDAIPRNLSITTINNKTYAKIMFVQNKNYKDNMNIATKLNNILKENYPTISRGIYDQFRNDFNQDLNGNVVLLELGSNNNQIEEILNTIDALALSIGELLK